MRLKVTLGALAGFNLLAALVYQWIVLTRLGVGYATDALFAGMVVPQVVLLIVSGALVSVLVPVLSGEPDEALRETAWGAFLVVTGTTGILAAVLFVTAPLWVGWLLPGFRSRDLDLAVSLTRIQLPGMIFMAAVSVPLAAWYARRRFLWPEMTPVLSTLVCLGPLLALLERYGVTAAAWVSTGKSLLFLLLVLPGLGPWKRPSWSSPNLALVRSRLRPLLGGNLYYKSDVLVDRALSSLAPPGDLSILYLSQQIWNAASKVLTVGVGRTMVPLLARQAKEGKWVDLRAEFQRRLRVMLPLAVGSVVLFAAVGRPLLQLLIGHGGVTRDNVDSLWRVMIVLGVAFVSGCLGQITSQGFYAIGDTRTPTRLGIATFTLYLPLKFLAFRAFGIYGLAAATGGFVLVNVILQYVLLNRRLRMSGVR